MKYLLISDFSIWTKPYKNHSKHKQNYPISMIHLINTIINNREVSQNMALAFIIQTVSLIVLIIDIILIIIHIASLLVKEQRSFWTYVLISLAIGCFNMFELTVISRSTLI